MSRYRCGATAEPGTYYEPGHACGRPADWYLEHVGRGDAAYWACEDHARDALLYMGGECSDAATGEPAELDEDHAMRVVA